MTDTQISRMISHDSRVCQLAAETMWQVATSENPNIARYDSAVYKATEKALVTSIRTVYGLGLARALKVRDLLAEYGPDDSLTGTQGRGIESYVEYVLTNRGCQTG